MQQQAEMETKNLSTSMNAWYMFCGIISNEEEKCWFLFKKAMITADPGTHNIHKRKSSTQNPKAQELNPQV